MDGRVTGASAEYRCPQGHERTFTFRHLDAPMNTSAYCPLCRRWCDWLRLDVNDATYPMNHPRNTNVRLYRCTRCTCLRTTHNAHGEQPASERWLHCEGRCFGATLHHLIDQPTTNHQETTTMSTTTSPTQYDDPTKDCWSSPPGWDRAALTQFIYRAGEDIQAIVSACHAEADRRGWCSDYDTIAGRIAERLNWTGWIPPRSSERVIEVSATVTLNNEGSHRPAAELVTQVIDQLRRGSDSAYWPQITGREVTTSDTVHEVISTTIPDWENETTMGELRNIVVHVAADARSLVHFMRRYARDRQPDFVPAVIEALRTSGELSAPWFSELVEVVPRELTFTVTVRPAIDDLDSGEVIANEIQEVLTQRLSRVQEWRVELTRESGAPARVVRPLPHDAWSAMTQEHRNAHVAARHESQLPRGWAWHRPELTRDRWLGADEPWFCGRLAAHDQHHHRVDDHGGTDVWCPGLAVPPQVAQWTDGQEPW